MIENKTQDKIALVTNRIRRARIALNLQQADLAKALGLNASGYNKIENGKSIIRLEQLFIISEAMGIPLSLLLTGFDKNSETQENDLFEAFIDATSRATKEAAKEFIKSKVSAW